MNPPPSETSVEPRWLTADEQASWRSYLLGVQMLADRLDDELREQSGLSMVEYEVMVRLSESPGRQMRMAVLADSLAHSRSRITHTVTRMEVDGLVERCEVSDDRRGVVARLSDKGWERLQSAAPVHVAGVREHLVDVAGADFEVVGRVMRAVADHLGGGPAGC
ncbi:MarR family winged helix-turn-helix transcriptional regulator [Nocardioides montaniterrae]